MKADSINLLEFIGASKRTFFIPVYQRNYDWKKVHCETLFKDIEALAKDERRSSHFLGTIVYVEGDSNATYREFSVIDGQQRLTTIMLLLKAIADSTDDEDLKVDIIESYLINRRCAEELRIKLKPMKSDAYNYEKLIDGFHEEMDESQIKNNYALFMELIKKSEFSIEQIYDGVQKLVIVYIALEREKENPQLIFESLNSTGLDLTQADLIRNFLLMGQKPEVQENYYNKYWLKLEKMLPDANISEYIRDFLTLKTGNIPNINQVYIHFKDYFRTREDESVESFLEEITRYGEYYSWFKFCDCKDKEVNIRLNMFQRLKSTTVYPFLLFIFEKYYHSHDFDIKIMLNSLDILVSYVMRRLLCEMPTNALNKVFAAIGKEIIKTDGNLDEQIILFLAKRTGKTIFPNDTMVKERVMNRDFYSFKHVKLIFEQIEKKQSKETVDFENISIEHIMPQTLTSKWKVDLGNKVEEIYEKYLHNIGNLTLTGYNSELSNESFDIKKEKYSKSNISITKALTKYDEWNEINIVDRAKFYVNEILEIWNCPDIINNVKDEKDNRTEFDIIDEVNVTGRSPIELEICGERFKLSSWRDFLRKICIVLYEYDQQIFRSLPKHPDFTRNGKNILNISPDGMRSPEEIVDGLWFEMNMSAYDILNYAKLFIDKYEGMDETVSYKLAL